MASDQGEEPQARDDRPEWVARHQGHREAFAREPVEVAILGDSMVSLWTTEGKEAWDLHLASRGARAAGISADRTEHLRWRIQDGLLRDLHPGAVVLLIGTNDLKSGPIRRTPDAVAQGIQAVVSDVRQFAPHSRVLVLSLLPRQPEYPWIDADIRAVNERLANLPGTEWVDAAPRFRKADGSVSARLYQRDRLHLNAEGYAVLTEILADALDRNRGS